MPLLPPATPGLTVVLNLDMTLVWLGPVSVPVESIPDELKVLLDYGPLLLRPYLHQFLDTLGESGVEVVIWTAASRKYAKAVVGSLQCKAVPIIISRDDGDWFKTEASEKDLAKLGRPLDKVVLVETKPDPTSQNKQNTIIIAEFKGDIQDNVLQRLGGVIKRLHGVSVPNFLRQYIRDISALKQPVFRVQSRQSDPQARKRPRPIPASDEPTAKRQFGHTVVKRGAANEDDATRHVVVKKKHVVVRRTSAQDDTLPPDTLPQVHRRQVIAPVAR
eukprot:TRINITY_DN14988_c0_g1_i2.p1 TRINITY_DN14988_c0_g1~~TRINITY_DN14988_c0_g1_i2.p1  ORF type:complete len:282 (+),score=47.60 TRINITY_DN14988_c0_g1_i2:23-847(+)